MSERRLSDDELRRHFQSLTVSPAHECTPEDLDRIWRALDGELPAAERRSLVERLSTEPVLAEAWRVAHQLRPEVPVAEAAAESHRRSYWLSASWVAAAAVLMLAVTTVLVLRRDPSRDDTFRDAGQYVIESLVGADTALPRDAFRLRWSPGPQDSRYQVRVTTEDLQLLAAVSDLSEPELVVESASLSKVPSGSRVLWQVEASLPGGERITSTTFVARVQPGS